MRRNNPTSNLNDDFLDDRSGGSGVASEVEWNEHSSPDPHVEASSSSGSKAAMHILIVTTGLVIIEIIFLRHLEKGWKKARMAAEWNTSECDLFGLPPLRPSTAIDLILAKAEAQVSLEIDNETEESETDGVYKSLNHDP